MKRLNIIFIALAGTMLVAALSIWYFLGREGSSGLERWIGRNLIKVVSNYINPTITFTDLDYQAPYTVIITGLTVTADDQSIIAVRKATLELAEIPSQDSPIQIQRIELDQPDLRFLNDPARGLIGWHDFVRMEAQENPESVPDGQRLSDVFALRHVDIKDGRITYDAGDGSEPMVLPGINVGLNTEPATDDPGWYSLKTEFQRPPNLKMTLDSRLNLDTSILDITALNFDAQLEEAQYETFPLPVQNLLRDHNIRGVFTAHLEGQYPLKNIEQATGQFQADLKDAFVSFDKMNIPVDEFSLSISIADGAADATYHVAALKGSVRGSVTLELTLPHPLRASWDLNDVQIAEALRVVQQGEPKYQGLVRSEGEIGLKLENLQETLSGNGHIHIEDGRLMEMPIIKDIIKVISKITFSDDQPDHDQADVVFTLHPDHVHLIDTSVVSTVAAMRGKGRINFDQTVDMEVKAGPLERLEAGLGKIGKLIGKVSDTLIVYTVKGTLDEPKVSVKPPDIKSDLESLDVLGVFK